MLQNLSSTEEQLAALLTAGECQRVSEIAYEQYGDGLYAFMLGTTRSPADADDLFQQLWLQVIEGLPRFEQRSTVKWWIYRIAHNLVAKWCNSRGLQVNLPPEVSAHTLSTTNVTDERNRRILEILKLQLKDDERELLVLLCSEEKLSSEDIGSRLQIRQDTARKRIQRLIEKLRELAKKYLSPEERALIILRERGFSLQEIADIQAKSTDIIEHDICQALERKRQFIHEMTRKP